MLNVGSIGLSLFADVSPSVLGSVRRYPRQFGAKLLEMFRLGGEAAWLHVVWLKREC